jgi:hypothetical protein
VHTCSCSIPLFVRAPQLFSRLHVLPTYAVSTNTAAFAISYCYTETTSKKSKKSKKSADLPSLQDSTSWPAPNEAKELPVEASEKKEKRPPRGNHFSHVQLFLGHLIHNFCFVNRQGTMDHHHPYHHSYHSYSR